MKNYQTPNNFGELIIEELQKQEFVGEEIICRNITDRLRESYGKNFTEPIKKDLDFLTEQGTITRYDLHLPENPIAEINYSCDELVYHLPKKRAKLTQENICALDINTCLPRIA